MQPHLQVILRCVKSVVYIAEKAHIVEPALDCVEPALAGTSLCDVPSSVLDAALIAVHEASALSDKPRSYGLWSHNASISVARLSFLRMVGKTLVCDCWKVQHVLAVEKVRPDSACFSVQEVSTPVVVFDHLVRLARGLAVAHFAASSGLTRTLVCSLAALSPC